MVRFLLESSVMILGPGDILMPPGGEEREQISKWMETKIQWLWERNKEWDKMINKGRRNKDRVRSKEWNE